jgi:hypothetical protein
MKVLGVEENKVQAGPVPVADFTGTLNVHVFMQNPPHSYGRQMFACTR